MLEGERAAKMSPTFEKGSAAMAAYGDVTTDAWAAIVIGAVELVMLAMMGIAAVMRWRRSRHDVTTQSQAAPTCREPQHEDGIPYWRCHDLIAEALIVRDRVAGHIDAATYQARMSELVSGARR